MNFRRFLSGIFYSIGDAFDSAKVSPRRGTPPGAYPTDAKNELPSYTRNELVRRRGIWRKIPDTYAEPCAT